MLSAKFNDSPNIFPSGPDSDGVGKTSANLSALQNTCPEARNVTDIQNRKTTWLKPH